MIVYVLIADVAVASCGHIMSLEALYNYKWLLPRETHKYIIHLPLQLIR